MWENWVFVQDKSRVPSQPVVYVGCMTGTSVDHSADFTAAVFDAAGKPVCYRNEAVSIPQPLRMQLLSLSKTAACHITIQARAEAEVNFTRFLITAYHRVIKALGLSNYPADRIVLSPHGQAIDHKPHASLPYTDILVNGELLAHRSGYKVVTRHRQAPLVVSSAAPLAPVLIKQLFSSAEENTCVLNGGGIANICILFEDASKKLMGYDTGPANAPLDAIVQHVVQSDSGAIPTALFDAIEQHNFDVGGAWAAQGTVIPALFDRLMAHEYFARPLTQKSADRAEFGLDWILDAIAIDKGKSTYAWSDILATVVEVVAQTIVSSILLHLPGSQQQQAKCRIIVYGGILHHKSLISQIRRLLDDQGCFEWIPMRELNYDPDFFESLLFAYLGYCADNKIPIDLSYCKRDECREDHAFAIPGTVAYPLN